MLNNEELIITRVLLDFGDLKLENFIVENSKEIKGICMYLESLIGLNEIENANSFLESLNDEIINDSEIKKIVRRLKLIKESSDGPSLEKLNEELLKNPENIDVVFKIADTHFANNNFDSSFKILFKYYPKNKEKVKTKILSFFDVLGFEHESTILYRKKLSSIMFS